MSTYRMCDACGEGLANDDQRIAVSITDTALRLTMAQEPLGGSYDFHRSCYLSSIKPALDELRAR